jgi:hypothetical protein
MSLNKNITIKTLFVGFIILASFAFKDEKDPLHKRKFTVNLTEVKDNVPAKKSAMDEMEFKNGKLFSNYLYDKFQYKWIGYRINKDSVFIDSTDTEVRLLVVESTFTDDANQTVMLNFSIQEWDIDGYIKIVGKNDKIKKYFDLAGFEKGGKPKKVKKPKVKKPGDPETY